MELTIQKQQTEINELKEMKNNSCSNRVNNINIQQNIIVNETTQKIREFGSENMKAIPYICIDDCFNELK